MDDDDEPLTSKLFDLIIHEFEQRFVAEAERLGVSNDDLEKAAAEMTEDGPGLGSTFAYFCRHVINVRRLQGLCALIQPGELERGGVALVDLIAREARTKTSA